MVEIGAGDGSLARIDELERIQVGPESSRASPGPACYGQGGTEPAITDADLMLGFLDENRFAGGRIRWIGRPQKPQLQNPLELNWNWLYP